MILLLRLRENFADYSPQSRLPSRAKKVQREQRISVFLRHSLMRNWSRSPLQVSILLDAPLIENLKA